jgi:excisionase family DNA binding protein
MKKTQAVKKSSPVTRQAHSGPSAICPARPIDAEQVLLRVDQTGRLLGVSTMTAYRFIKQGLIPRITLGRHIRVPKAELLHLIATNALYEKK